MIFNKKNKEIIINFLMCFSILLTAFNFIYIFRNDVTFNLGNGLFLSLISIFAVYSIIHYSLLIIKDKDKKSYLKNVIVIFIIFNITRGLTGIILSGFESEQILRIAWIRSNFFDSRTIVLFVMLIFIFLIVYLLNKYKVAFISKIERFLPNNTTTTKSLSFASLITILIILSNHSFNIITDNIFNVIYEDYGITLVTGLSASLYFIFITLAVFISSGLLYKGFKDLVKYKSSFSSAFVLSTILAYIFTIAIQYSILVEDTPLSFRGFLLQMLVVTIIFLIIYCLINRIVLATYVNLGLITMVVIPNYFKFNIRGEPVSLDDLSWLTQFDQLVNYTGELNYLPILISIIIVFVSFFLINKRIFKTSILKSNKLKLGIVIGFVLFMHLVYSQMMIAMDGQNRDEVFINNVFHRIRTWVGHTRLASREGYVLTLIYQSRNHIMDKPDGYSQEKMLEIQERYTDLAREINESRSNQINEQSVVFILSETTANPLRIPNVELGENPLPFITEIASTHGGLMISNGIGGGTANIEFEAITGMSMENFSLSVNTAFNSVVPRMDYVPAISNLFENRIMIHPANALSYNRLFIYRDLGYQEFYAQVNGTIDITDYKLFGEHISDETAYNITLEKLREAQEPVFINLLTMQNHVPYPDFDDRSQIEIINYPIFRGQSSPEGFCVYLSLLKETDRATKEFIDELLNLDKDVTIVFYGDHISGQFNASNFTEHPYLRSQTEFFIWSNHIENKSVNPVTTSYEFISTLLRTTDSQVTPFYALLTLINEELPIMQNNRFYDNQTGRIIDDYQLSELQRAILNDFALIHYDLTSGNGYLSQFFFEEIPE